MTTPDPVPLFETRGWADAIRRAAKIADTHAGVLRPGDLDALQAAVAFLSGSGHAPSTASLPPLYDEAPLASLEGCDGVERWPPGLRDTSDHCACGRAMPFDHDPENPTEFEAVLGELHALHLRKKQDYGSDEDPYENVVCSRLWGVAPWIGASVRLSDKEKRLQEAAKGKALANETVEDSLLDNCVYNIIRLILWRRQHVR